MTDTEWEEYRKRAIRTAFQTSRSVFADSEGELRFTGGSVPNNTSVPKVPLPNADNWWTKIRSWIRRKPPIDV